MQQFAAVFIGQSCFFHGDIFNYANKFNVIRHNLLLTFTMQYGIKLLKLYRRHDAANKQHTARWKKYNSTHCACTYSSLKTFPLPLNSSLTLSLHYNRRYSLLTVFKHKMMQQTILQRAAEFSVRKSPDNRRDFSDTKNVGKGRCTMKK